MVRMGAQLSCCFWAGHPPSPFTCSPIQKLFESHYLSFYNQSLTHPSSHPGRWAGVDWGWEFPHSKHTLDFSNNASQSWSSGKASSWATLLAKTQVWSEGTIMNDKRHSYHSGNFKSFRSSSQENETKIKYIFLLYHSFYQLSYRNQQREWSIGQTGKLDMYGLHGNRNTIHSIIYVAMLIFIKRRKRDIWGTQERKKSDWIQTIICLSSMYLCIYHLHTLEVWWQENWKDLREQENWLKSSQGFAVQLLISYEAEIHNL